ncbi:MAG TPA: hypothetical protein VF599_22425 [Pyrinomonadaceae bacterium]|jgi:hypothetical protein
MNNSEPLRFRLVACREALDDGKQWSFYLMNDSRLRIDSAVLYEIGYEWGDTGSSEAANMLINALDSGAHALIWRDDGSGAELRMQMFLRVRISNREMKLDFEFPKLYLQRNLKMVDELGKPGWQVNAEGKFDTGMENEPFGGSG